MAALIRLAFALAVVVSGCSGDEDPVRAFPEGFVWGVAGAAHESEGRNDNSDWQAFEDVGRAPPAGWAQNGYELYETDAQNAASLGLGSFQLGIEWARVVPRMPADPSAPLTDADVDHTELAHYHAVIDAVIAHGLTPVVAVTHFSLPRWVSNPAAYDADSNEFTDGSLGAFTNPLTAVALARYAELLVREFGDQVKWWITIDEPMVVLLAGYMTGDFPPGFDGLDLDSPRMPHGATAFDVMKNMIDSHAKAYDAMKAVRGDISVSFAQNLVAWSPLDPTSDADVAATRRVDEMYNWLFVDALAFGELDTGLVGDGPNEMHPEWVGRLDYLGVNFYDHDAVVDATGLFPPLGAIPCAPALAGGFPAIFAAAGCPADGVLSEPEGMTRILLECERRYGLPIVVTENGFIDTPDGKARRLVEILAAVHEAIAQGADVRAYHYWTLNYDYEWNSGWTENMGLFTIAGFPGPADSADPAAFIPGPDTDFTRVPLHPVVDVFEQIARHDGIPESLAERYAL